MTFLFTATLLIITYCPVLQPAHCDSARAPQAPTSVLKFTIAEHDLYPENIAYDPVTGDYFLGSMSRSRILRIRRDGSYEDFVSRPDPDLLSSIGMKVDPKRRFLWVCTGRFSLFRDYDSAPAKTGVLLFSIDDGSLIRKWLMPQESDYHIFNDLTLAPNGDAYATTTLMGKIYRISPESDDLVLVHQLQPGRHNNGLDFDSSGQFLFVAIDRSIYRLELANGSLVRIAAGQDEDLGADGIYFHDGSLVVVKPRFNRVSQLFLNRELTSVDRVVTLAQDHPDFGYPTTGVIVGDKLVFVATSFANVPRNAGRTDQHSDVLIHVVPLG
jgi:sugar lactone lactonase YvrE